MPLDVINRRYPGTLCQSEVIDQDGITHAHPIKRVAAQLRHFDPGLRRVDSECGIEHEKSPAVASTLYRQICAFLESGLYFQGRLCGNAPFARDQYLPALHPRLVNKPNISKKDVENEKMSAFTRSVRAFYRRAAGNWEIPARTYVFGILVDAFDYRGIFCARPAGRLRPSVLFN
jgi:hypothetical protein